jgi:hypothetical protein
MGRVDDCVHEEIAIMIGYIIQKEMESEVHRASPEHIIVYCCAMQYEFKAQFCHSSPDV